MKKLTREQKITAFLIGFVAIVVLAMTLVNVFIRTPNTNTTYCLETDGEIDTENSETDTTIDQDAENILNDTITELQAETEKLKQLYEAKDYENIIREVINYASLALGGIDLVAILTLVISNKKSKKLFDEVGQIATKTASATINSTNELVAEVNANTNNVADLKAQIDILIEDNKRLKQATACEIKLSNGLAQKSNIAAPFKENLQSIANDGEKFLNLENVEELNEGV